MSKIISKIKGDLSYSLLTIHCTRHQFQLHHCIFFHSAYKLIIVLYQVVKLINVVVYLTRGFTPKYLLPLSTVCYKYFRRNSLFEILRKIERRSQSIFTEYNVYKEYCTQFSHSFLLQFLFRSTGNLFLTQLNHLLQNKAGADTWGGGCFNKTNDLLKNGLSSGEKRIFKFFKCVNIIFVLFSSRWLYIS